MHHGRMIDPRASVRLERISTFVGELYDLLSLAYGSNTIACWAMFVADGRS